MDYSQENNAKRYLASTINPDISKLTTNKLLVKENTQISNIQAVSTNPYAYKIPREDSLLAVGLVNLAKNSSYSPHSTKSLNFAIKKTKFPESFNPRKEINMPQNEKVEKWMTYLPIIAIDNDYSLWENRCYEPTIPMPIDDDDEKNRRENDGDISFPSDHDVIEYQSKLITLLVNEAYFKEAESVRRSDGKFIPNIDFNNYFVDDFKYCGFPQKY
jgi:hypothetical protein